MGEVGEYFETCCHSRFAVGKGNSDGQTGPIPKSASGIHGVEPAQEQDKSTGSPSWDTQGWKCSSAALWKMPFPNRWAVVGDGEVQSPPGFAWTVQDRGQEQSGATSTYWVLSHLVVGERNGISGLLLQLET